MKKADANTIKIPTEDSIVVVPFSVCSDGAELRLAINVHKITSVIPVHSMDSLPTKFSPFVGVVNVSSVAIPVFDLSTVFREEGKASQSACEKLDPSLRRIIICNFQNFSVGILVDKTRKLEQYPSTMVQPPPEAFHKNENCSFFSAVIQEGSTYTYLLDIEGMLARHGLELVEQSHSPDTMVQLKNKSILVVEDSPFFMKRTVQIFKKLGAHIETATNGKEALEVLKRKNFQFDLVFTDIEMPVMNGIQLAVEVKSTSPIPLPVLFNSAISNPQLIDELKSKQLGDYIVKFDEATIKEKLEQLFAS